RCTLLVHPSDAQRLGLADGEEALLSSAVGEVRVPVEVSDEVMPGVVSLPHGWGHGRRGVRLSVATKHPGVSINDVTDDSCVDELTGTAALSGQRVAVREIGRASCRERGAMSADGIRDFHVTGVQTCALPISVEVSDEVMPGVVSLPHGWGHGRRGVRLSVATKHPGVSINDVTDDSCVDELTGTAALSGQRVAVRALAATPV